MRGFLILAVCLSTAIREIHGMRRDRLFRAASEFVETAPSSNQRGGQSRNLSWEPSRSQPWDQSRSQPLDQSRSQQWDRSRSRPRDQSTSQSLGQSRSQQLAQSTSQPWSKMHQLDQGGFPVYNCNECPRGMYCSYGSRRSQGSRASAFCYNTNTWGPRQCYQYPSQGWCNGRQLRYYYDMRTGRCLRFIWTGCGGNSNRFQYYEDCQQSCNPGYRSYRYKGAAAAQGKTAVTGGAGSYKTGAVATKKTTVGKCFQPKNIGSCDSTVYIRYYYDASTKQCRRFNFSGCGGNDNRFTSSRSCKRACMKTPA